MESILKAKQILGSELCASGGYLEGLILKVYVVFLLS